MLDDELRKRIFENAMALWFEPEIRRRQERGLAPKLLPLIAAQVIIYPDNRPHEVRLNEEVKASATPHLKNGRIISEGELIYEHDLEGISAFELADSDDPNCGHFTLVLVNGRWFGSFDFRYNKRKSAALIDAAREFFETATYAASKGKIRAAIDNLFSAAELAATAYILTTPVPGDATSKKHGRVSARFNISSRHGDIQSEQRKTFNELAKARAKARYVEGDVATIADRLPKWQADVDGLISRIIKHVS